MSSKNKGYRSHDEWIKLAKSIRKDRDIKIYKFLNTLKGEDSDYSKMVEGLPDELKPEFLYKMTIGELRAIVLKQLISAENLLNIFYSRALLLGIKLEGIADVNIDRAFEIARSRDELISKTDLKILEQEADIDHNAKGENPKFGLLFGVPISIKDTYEQKGRAIF